MTTLEEKELKGVSTKFLVWLIVHTAIVVATACGFFFTLKSDIRDILTGQQGKYEYWEEKLKSLQIQNEIYRKQQEGIQIQIDELRRIQLENSKK